MKTALTALPLLLCLACSKLDQPALELLSQPATVRVNALVPCLGPALTPQQLAENTPFKVADYFGEPGSLGKPGLGASQRSVPWCLVVLETQTLNGAQAMTAADELLTRKLYTRPYGLSLEQNAYASDPGTQSFDTNCDQLPALEREAASAQPIRVSQLRDLLGVRDANLDGRNTTVAVLDGGAAPGTFVSVYSRRFLEPDYPSTNPNGFALADDFDCAQTPHFDGHGASVVRVLRAIAPQTNVLLLKVCNAKGVCSTGSIIKALLYIRNRYKGVPLVDVVNMSFGGRPPLEDGVFKAMLQDMMVEDPQTLFVTSMGNAPDSPAHYPADYQGMHFSLVAVAAAKLSPTSTWTLASFNTSATLGAGSYAPLAAPAVRLVVDDATGRTVTGTSFAAPVVTAIALLKRQQDPNANAIASHLHWNLQVAAEEIAGFKLLRLDR